MSEPAEPLGPEKPFVLQDRVTVFEFAQLAQSLDPELARTDPEEAYQKALAFLQGSAAFIERNAYWQARFKSDVTQAERKLPSAEDYFSSKDPKDVKRLLDYVNEHLGRPKKKPPFKTFKRFLKAYDKEKLRSFISNEFDEKRRSSETGQMDQRFHAELCKERIIQKLELDKFIELYQEGKREQDAARKRRERGSSET